MKEIRDNARKMMQPFCKVCPICNGKACAGQVPGMGGLMAELKQTMVLTGTRSASSVDRKILFSRNG